MPQCLYNYSAGPAMIPQQVQQQILEDLRTNAASVSLLELGHRTPEFCRIAEQAEQNLRQLLNISQDYAVLFLAGGASAQYAMVPMNLAQASQTLDYIDSGHWSKLAIHQAQAYNKVNVISALEQDANGQTTLSDKTQWNHSKDATYCHYVDNETLTGIELPNHCVTAECPLVCDMTSNFLSREFDLAPFGIVYAGAQKNMGIAGVTVVLVRKNILQDRVQTIPLWEDYRVQIKNESRYNTPPIFSWYVCGLVCAWTLAQGGVVEMERRAVQRSQLLYQAVDKSSLYENNIAPALRSRNNIHFHISDAKLEQKFIEKSIAQGLFGLRGHRAVGGIRASLYNAMTMEGVEALVSFMQEFERTA